MLRPRAKKNSLKIRTCLNKIYNNHTHIILFDSKNNRKPHPKSATCKTMVFVLKAVKCYNHAL